MSEFKGTPGPWKVNTIGQHWNNKSLTHIEVTFGMEGERVCDTVYEMADANLIAAAPELLEALRQLRDYVEDVLAVSTEDCDQQHPLMLATSVISKALDQ